MRLRTIALLAAVLVFAAARANATITIDRTFGYDDGRNHVVQRGGYTHIDRPGAGIESRAGLPELPWVSERIDLPPGQRVVGVEVTGVESRTLATGASLAPTLAPTPGFGPEERSKPDPTAFANPSPSSSELVSLGAQGGLRGRSVAWLKVAPTQWDPATGTVRVFTRISVRLTLDTDPEPPLKRERIVSDWEDAGSLPTGSPTRELGSVLTTMSPGSGGKAAPFSATQVPSLLGSPVAYVIVTNDAMAPTFQQLADWKTSMGLPAVVRTVSFIHQQYPSAADDAERIRLFLRDAYTRWGTKWVLLGGDTDVIPVRLGATTFYGGEMIATDLYYSCLDGNWNANGDSLYGQGQVGLVAGDGADMMPEVYVGRAPVTSPSQAQVFVNKTLQYERYPVGDYENRWLFFAEVLFPRPWTPGTTPQTDGGDMAEQMLPLTDEIPALHVGRLYYNWTDPKWRPGVAAESRVAVLDSLSAGYGLALHIGHGYRNVMEVGDGSLTNGDAMALTNGNRLFNLYAINCTSNAIDFPCIGEAFLLNPNGGAVTNVGSTRYDFPQTGELYQYEYFRLFVEDSVTAVGELNARQKLPFVPYSGYDGVDRWTQMTLLMLGDPELRMWRVTPRTLTVSAPTAIALSDTQFTVHVAVAGAPLAGAQVTAYRPNADWESGTTDASGNVTLPFRPDSLGTLSLGVTALNARPVLQNITITAASGAVLVASPAAIVDDGSGGTVGDGNASLDGGETVDLVVPLENQGGAGASGVTATLGTTDGLVTLVTPVATYGTVATGSVQSPTTRFRISVPYTLADQREIPFTMTITDGAGHSWRQKFQVVSHSPALRSYAHYEYEPVGNQNGLPEYGETVNYVFALTNSGTGIAHNVTLTLRSYDGLVTVADSIASFGDIAPGATVYGDAVQFTIGSLAGKLNVLVSDSYGLRTTQKLDMLYPPVPTKLLATGRATSVALTWTHVTLSDLLGFNVYRGSGASGPWTKVTNVPTDRIAYYTDADLAPLTRYYYMATSVDSSGNESGFSAVTSTSTNPPLHGIFPVPTTSTTSSSIALDEIWSTSQMDILVGSDRLYVLHADGTAPVDADASSATLGDFSSRGSGFMASPSAAILDAAQGWSIVCGSWDSSAVYVFDKTGAVRPGWPVVCDAPVWSAVAIGDLDGDGKMELVWATNGNKVYAVHADGTELIDGDNNPSTKGVFKTFTEAYNYGSPVLADIDGDGKPEIIYGSHDHNLYVWKADGSNLPGFPYHTAGPITASAAVGYLDGPGDTVPDIVFTSNSDSLFVLEPNGSYHPGFPFWTRVYHPTSKSPSVALADMNNDGYLDIVQQSTNGYLYCFDHNGNQIPTLSNIKYTTISGAYPECSPVVADINGDGFNDVVMGDELGRVTAISGADGSMLPGFPIQLGGEVRGAPAVADIDHDGKTEIMVAGWDKNIYVWDYDFPYQPSGKAPWPQFHHDARHTGFSGAPLYLGAVDDGPLGSGATRTLEFAPPSPNPAHGIASMWFGIPTSDAGQTYELAIFDVGGRKLRVVDTGIARAGQIQLKWDLRDSTRRPVGGGVYFARFSIGGQSLTRKLVVLN